MTRAHDVAGGAVASTHSTREATTLWPPDTTATWGTVRGLP